MLVAGATGYLGKYVVQEFKKHGFWIRALARNAAKLKSISKYIDESFIGEVTVPNSLQGICRDIDIVFSSIG
ncbi:NAD(P)H-binding protein, partial [Acidobacteriota bacterium]